MRKIISKLSPPRKLTLKEFIKRFVEPNTLVRIWVKANDGIHQHENTGVLEMEHRLLRPYWDSFTSRKVIGVTDILCPDRHPEAVNIVLEP
jgi:hypothetical protein